MAEENTYSTASFRAEQDFLDQLAEYVEKSEDFSSKSELIRNMLQDEFNRDARPLDQTWLEGQCNKLNKVARQAAEEDFDLSEKPLPSDFQQEVDDLKDQLAELNDDQDDLDSERDKLEERIVEGQANTEDLDKIQEKENKLSAKKRNLEARLQTLKSLKSRAQERMANIQEREDKIFDEKLDGVRRQVAERLGVAFNDFLDSLNQYEKVVSAYKDKNVRIVMLPIRELLDHQQNCFDDLFVHPLSQTNPPRDLNGPELVGMDVGWREDAEEAEVEEEDKDKTGNMDEEEATKLGEDNMILEEEEITEENI